MMIPSILLAIQVAWTDCTAAVREGEFDKLSDIMESAAKPPPPTRQPPTGQSIVTFRIAEDGKAIDVETVCGSSDRLSNFIQSFVRATRFRVPDDHARRYRLGFEITIGDDAKIEELWPRFDGR